jgi:hypothetical protein
MLANVVVRLVAPVEFIYLFYGLIATTKMAFDEYGRK